MFPRAKPARLASLQPSRRGAAGLGILLIALLTLTLARAWDATQTPITTDPATARQTIDLNHADSDLLQLLPGIGPRRAEAIVEERRARGVFVSLEDLQRVSGIGPRTIDRIAPFVRVGPPPEIAASPSPQD